MKLFEEKHITLLWKIKLISLDKKSIHYIKNTVNVICIISGGFK